MGTGPVEAKKIAQLSPEKVLKSYIAPTSFQSFQGRKLAYAPSPAEIGLTTKKVIEMLPV